MEHHSTPPDAESHLIAQAIDGDAKSIAILYDRYLNQLFNYVYYRVGNGEETELLTEKIFIKLFENLPRYQKEEKRKHFLAWVFNIANQEIDRYLRTHPKAKHDISDDYLDEEQEAIVKALRSLDKKSYQFIVSRFFNGLTNLDTARILGINEESVHQTQLKALKALAKTIKKDGQNG